MKQEMLNHFSYFWMDFALTPEDYFLVLTDDMDSYYSCKYLKKRFGAEIGGFYQFGKGLYLTQNEKLLGRTPIYIDCAVVQDGVCCFDNHRTMFSNHMSINPNLVINRLDNNNYYKKYCGSTLMLLYALYHGDLSELEKEFIIAIDGFYIGWYRENGKYRHINQFWLDMLEISEDLTPILEKRNLQYFIDLTAKWQLKEKIYINEDEHKLFTFADILPSDPFYLDFETESKKMKKGEVKNIGVGNRSVFTAAETYDGSYLVDFAK